MHPAASRIAENATKHRLLLVPLLFTILGAVGSVNSPVQHSLLVTSASWAILWIPLACRLGFYSNSAAERKNLSWLAGAFLALAHICDRAACDKDGIRATKVGAHTQHDMEAHWLTGNSGCSHCSPFSSRRTSCCPDTSPFPRTPAATRAT